MEVRVLQAPKFHLKEVTLGKYSSLCLSEKKIEILLEVVDSV